MRRNATISKGTDMLAKKRRGVERSSNASHSDGLAQIGSVMNRREKFSVDQKCKGTATNRWKSKGYA
jgi:hypothetical protein|nr:MAG TPA: hypothetical protein [Caudoviricetes sp.]